MSADLTHDAFLNGRVYAWQPRSGYRAATDAVFLAAACPAREGDAVLELGCGVGVASLCLQSRVPGLAITGVERQPSYSVMARQNVADAGAAIEIVEADLASLPIDLRQRSFDHVIANPPFLRAGAGTPSTDAGREAAFREETPLADWIACARARLKPKGWLTMIHLAERLPACLAALSDGFGSISVLPLQSRAGRPAGRILLKARKGGAAPFQLLAPFVLHAAATHKADGEDFTAAAAGVLRHAEGIDWGA